MQAGDDEYGMRAKGAQPWSPSDGTAADPWSCLWGCDRDSSCLAVFTTKNNGSWSCWLLEGGISLGFTAGSIKVAPTQINAYFWAWNTVPTDMPNRVSRSQACSASCQLHACTA